MNNLFTADVGQGKVHVFDRDRGIFYPKLPDENLINLDIEGLEEGDTLVVECAHLRESHRFTLAQPFNYEQLTTLEENAKERGVSIRLFPQKSTPKARKLAGVSDSDKSDEADTKAIADFLTKDTNAFDSLKVFVPTKLEEYHEKNDSVFSYIQESNNDINPAKTSGYGFKKSIQYSDNVSRWIDRHKDQLVKELDGDPELLELLGLKYLKNGTLKVDVPNRIYTLVHSLIRPMDDGLRVRHDNGLVPYWKYVKANYLGCKPYHMNQGVAASNYKHWLRRAVSPYENPDKTSSNSSDFLIGMSHEEYLKLKEARTIVDKMTQKVWNILRKMIVDDGLR